mmetsp:Transcript_2776/g.10137  ORF Transcript_2776/g.10137 Transcript_2776/m.10137 type:complete len:296 (+) Transcript_2776:291-1178(+)
MDRGPPASVALASGGADVLGAHGSAHVALHSSHGRPLPMQGAQQQPQQAAAPAEAQDPRKQWEALRREARKLESALDAKLSAYAKVSVFPEAVSGLLSPTCTGTTLEAEIAALLGALTDTNDALSRCGGVGGLGLGLGAAATAHTLARHRDILNEFTQEFKRARANVSNGRQRAQLLDMGSTSGGAAVGIGGGASDMLEYRGNAQAWRKEQRAVGGINQEVDVVLGQAQSARSQLQAQRGTLLGASSKLSSVGGGMAMVGTIIGSIQRKKNKDSMVVALVCALCTVLLFVYWLFK